MGATTISPQENKDQLRRTYRSLQKRLLRFEEMLAKSRRPLLLRWLPKSKYEKICQHYLDSANDEYRKHINLMRTYGAFDDLV